MTDTAPEFKFRKADSTHYGVYLVTPLQDHPEGTAETLLGQVEPVVGHGWTLSSNLGERLGRASSRIRAARMLFDRWSATNGPVPPDTITPDLLDEREGDADG